MPRILPLLTLLLALLAGPAAAQEVQIPLDREGRVTTVDRALALRLGLWTAEYPGFREARLFQAPDSSYLLEITTERGGVAARSRVPLTASEADALRDRIAGLLAERAPEAARAELNQEGRYLLLGQTTLVGATFYGGALPYALGMDGSGAAAAYLLTAAGSFFVPWALTEGEPVTFGMANLSRYGVTRGAAHGLLLDLAIAGGDDPDVDAVCDEFGCYYGDSDESDERRRAAAALAFSVAEGVGGYLWARDERMTAGTVGAMVAGGDFGLGFGALSSVLIGGGGSQERLTATLALAGAGAGIATGRSLARARDLTWGDADLVYTGGLVGGYVGFATAALADPDLDNDRLGAGMTLLGGVAGLMLADRLVRDADFTVGQATLNRLGALAGALAGASLGVGAESDRAVFAGSAMGAALGYYGTYAALAPRAREQQGERMSALELRVAPGWDGVRVGMEYRW